MNDKKEMNAVGRISHFFVVNRPLSLLLLIVTLIFGLLAFFLTPKQYNPEIVRPAFLVQLAYQGATIEEAENRVVYELNEKINTVPGVDEVFTEVKDGAVITTTVIFEVGFDPVKAKLDLVSQLQQHSYLAKGLILPPHVIEINPETIPVMQIAFSAEGESISELREKITKLSQVLSAVENVSELSVYGGYQSKLIVEIDPVRLDKVNVTINEIIQTLNNSQKRWVSQGVKNSANQIEIVFDGRSVNAEEVGLLKVRENILMRDVARVYEGSSGNRSYAFYRDKDSLAEVIMLSVAKVEGSSAPIVTKEMKSAIETALKTEEFSGLKYKIVSDDGVTATNEISGLTSNLISSIIIVALVLLLFLSVRSALVVLIAIPTTLLIVFGIGYLFDQTINRITLFALILSLGLLVDSAIVVVENIYSHLKEWKNENEAITREHVIARAVDEIGVGLLLSALTSVIVFLPMRYISGMMGPYMSPIAFFVPTALIVSLLVAIIVTPYVASYALHGEEKPNFVTKHTIRIMNKVTSTYKSFLEKVLYDRKKQRFILSGVLMLLAAALLLPIFGVVHFQMLPKADRNQFYVYVDLPIDTSVDATGYFTDDLSKILLEDSDILHIQSFVGTAPIVDFNGMYKGAGGRNGSNQATLRVNLRPADERDRSSTEITNDIRSRLSSDEVFSENVKLIEEPPGPPVMATIVAKFSSNDRDLESSAAQTFSEFIKGISGVVDIDTSIDETVGRVRYELDQVAADKFGVSSESIQATLMLLEGGFEIGEFQSADNVEYTPIVISIPANLRDAPNDISSLSVPSNSGKQVPLLSVLKLTHELRPTNVRFEEANSLTYVTAEIEGRPVIYVVMEIIRALTNGELVGYKVNDWNLFGLTLESDNGDLINLNWGGEWEMTLENFRDLGIAMGAALFMVYAVLVAQYNKFSTPAYILVTVPLALIGIIFGFLVLDNIFGIYLTATALIGFIALIGIVVNNAIIFLEYVEQAVAKGSTFRQALIAAGETRLRPILLTSLTTILGSLTIVGDPVWSGLAWSIVFGLSLSTLLTLVVYPILLVYFTSEKE